VGEYVVGGIKTTLPFFAWLLDQPDFAAGRFHTTFLDELLTTRNGVPFVASTPATEDLAVIAATIDAMLSPGPLLAGQEPVEPGSARWRTEARLDGLNRLALRD
jgi:hypothetical protein